MCGEGGTSGPFGKIKVFYPERTRASRSTSALTRPGYQDAAAANTIAIMDLVAGVDSSTQSTKVLLCRADDGTVVGSASAPHPAGTVPGPADAL